MARVKGPCFSIWASGSLGNVITYFWGGDNWRFHVQKKKTRSGKRSEKQIANAEIFRERMAAMRELSTISPIKGVLPITED